MYIKDEAIKQKAIREMDPIIQNPSADVKTHPTYAVFQRFLSSQRIDDALMPWRMLIDGLRLQIELNEAANRYIEAKHKDLKKLSNLLDFNSLLTTNVTDYEMRALYNDNFTYLCSRAKQYDGKDTIMYERAIKNLESFLKSLIRSSNTHYLSFANALVSLLKVQEGRELALWSGGIDLSDFSFKARHCPLEKTALGDFLNTNPITSIWDLEAPLWNIISRTFVLNYQGRVAHVYFRLIDDTSVLMRQEVPMLTSKSKGIAWHPIVNTTSTESSEIGTTSVLLPSFNTKEDTVTIATDKSCGPGMDLAKAIVLLCDKLKTGHYIINKRTLSSANSEIFEPTHPPFALDDDRTIHYLINLLHLNN